MRAGAALAVLLVGTARILAGDPYLDVMERAVSAYSDARIASFVAEVERDGVQEHGFPRLAANLGVLVANGRLADMKPILARMLTAACRDARKGMMPPKSGGNEFSVKELVQAVVALEKAGTFPKETTDRWRADLTAVAAADCYTTGRLKVGEPVARNWVVFAAASEQARLAHGMGGDAAFVDRYVKDQLRWFDANGMYRDPNQPAVYDFVTRLQFMHILDWGYDGPSRGALERQLERSAEPTLKMQSACGEIPYGGRSNQFLHNNTFSAAVCEWYAARFAKRGEKAKAARFAAAARRAMEALRPWLAENPVSHVKNRYPREEGKGVFSAKGDMGCERYAYFDKYMVTMGSWAMSAWRFATCPGETPAPPTSPSVFATTPDFHFVFLSAGDYSAQLDYNADSHYDCDGLGRLQRRGAPGAICLSTPCAKNPNYRIETPNDAALAFAPVVAGEPKLELVSQRADDERAVTEWKAGPVAWTVALSSEGLSATSEGDGKLAMTLPAFDFDGKERSVIKAGETTLTVAYRGWTCRYETDGRIVDTGRSACNRNGRYRRFEAQGERKLTVNVTIEQQAGAETTCLCGEAPERANDFFWENDCVGFRAYGPGDRNKWSGIDVFNKSVSTNIVVHWLRHHSSPNFHLNQGQGMDDYAVGPGRGVGGVALRKDGKWLPDYGNWVAYRVITNSDERCEFELDYKLPIGGTMTLWIMLPRGKSYFVERVMFSGDAPIEGVEVGVGLDVNPARLHKGDLRTHEGLKMVTLFEDPHDLPGEDGSMMSALVALPVSGIKLPETRLADEPSGAKVLLTEPLNSSHRNGKPVFFAALWSDWTGAGRHKTADEWNKAVRDEYRKWLITFGCCTMTKEEAK